MNLALEAKAKVAKPGLCIVREWGMNRKCAQRLCYREAATYWMRGTNLSHRSSIGYWLSQLSPRESRVDTTPQNYSLLRESKTLDQ